MLTRKTRVILTKEQEILFRKYEWCCRWLQNKYLEMAQKYYKRYWKKLYANVFNKYVTNYLFKTRPYLKEVPSKTRQNAVNTMFDAYDKFIQGKRWFPKFKKKKDNFKSIYFRTSDNQHYFRQKWNKIMLPVIKYVKIKNQNYIKLGKYSQMRLVYENWKYFWCFLDLENNIEKSNGKLKIWIDLGLNTFTVCSDWSFIEKINTKKLEDKINKIQFWLSRKVYWSKNYEKLRYKLRKTYIKKRNIEDDFLNKACVDLKNKWFGTVNLEDLNIAWMKEWKYSKSIHWALWGRFRLKLENKFVVNLIDRFFASSKTCSKCWNKKETLLISERKYCCESCGLKIDRDLNASINILNYC